MTYLRITVYVLFITSLGFGLVFGVSEPARVQISSPNATKDAIIKFNPDFDKIKRHTFHCRLTTYVKNGVIKFFQIIDDIHLHLNKNKNTNKTLSVRTKTLARTDCNTTIYCIIHYPSECNIPTEGLSNSIALNPTRASRVIRDDNRDVEIKINRVNGTNTFYVTCKPPKKDNINTLEIYKIIDNVATWVNDTRDTSDTSIVTGTITTCDNNTKVYCRAIIDRSDSFYSSKHESLYIYNQVNYTDCINATTQQCLVENNKSDESSTDNNDKNRTLSLNTKTVIIAVPSTIIGVLLMTIIISHAWKKCRIRERCKKEPKVLYAEIELSKQTNGDLPKAEEVPYAEIIGVLYPVDNNNRRPKPKKHFVEESPYAVPYVT